MRICQVIILGIAVLLFLLGGRKYDVRQRLGIKQIKEGTSNKALTDTGEMNDPAASCRVSSLAYSNNLSCLREVLG